MKILITGANGYIGMRLLKPLIERGHHVVALVRDQARFHHPRTLEDHHQLEIMETDILHSDRIELPYDIDVAYYLLHSMSDDYEKFYELEEKAICRFLDAYKKTSAKQLIYLSGITNEEKLSRHLASRKNVEDKIIASGVAYTILRAGIILGSGSASFEIIRGLVEKLPIMVAPKWVKNQVEPISIVDVVFYLTEVVGKETCKNRIFEIGNQQPLTYKEILLRYARLRGLKRWIITVPVLTLKLSSYWLVFMTEANYFLSRALVDSLQTNCVVKDRVIDQVVPHQCLTYDEALQRIFQKIEQNEVVSSWKDAMVMGRLRTGMGKYVDPPKHGSYHIVHSHAIGSSKEEVIRRLWAIGGKNGWYYMTWAWKLRGWIDKCVGGVGLSRGRRNTQSIEVGDVLDFWRVIVADKKKGRLLLYAEMKVPGEAWLQIELDETKHPIVLRTTATFRPKGLIGRLYWFILYPIHILIFLGMAKKLSA